MATTTHPVVTLTPKERAVLCQFLWLEVQERCNLADGDMLRLTRAAVHVFDALGWRQERPEYAITVDGEIAWLVIEILVPFVADHVPDDWRERFSLSEVVGWESEAWFDREYMFYEAIISATDKLTEYAGRDFEAAS
jgi:hypothetical protein